MSNTEIKASFDAADMATASADAFRASQAHGQKTNFDRVSAWLATAGKERTPKNLATQVGCHFEEFCEQLEAMTITSPTGAMANVLFEAKAVLQMLASGLKSGELGVAVHDREALLDSLCDQDVTLNGVAYLAGFDKNGADKEVLDSNDSKFNDDGTPVILDGGMIGKGPNYRAPNLAPFVGK